MSSADTTSDSATGMSVVGLDQKLEVVVIPVSDVDRATDFYSKLGWRHDVTPAGVVQLTPHGPGGSVQFRALLTSAAPRSGKAHPLVSHILAPPDRLGGARAHV